MRFAQRARAAVGGRPGTPARAYPLPELSEDGQALGVELAATRALASAESADEVVAVLATLVRDLGGALVPARLADPAMTLPIDVSLGVSEPVLAYVDPVSIGALRLGLVLPGFLELARAVVARLRGDEQRDDEAIRDGLTGLLTRRAFLRRLSGAVPGDSVCLLDLDHFKAVNDTEGHGAGDDVLRAFGVVLAGRFRDGDSCGRYGGDELVCLALGLPAAALGSRCDQVRSDWEGARPAVGSSVGVSIGVAPVGDEGGRAALAAADRAMYEAKRAGRNRTVLARDGA